MTITSSVLIIGAGNFGAATALSLIKSGNVKVTLVDTATFPNTRAASHDISKIVRDDYPDKLYMRMMAKAMPLWRQNELYNQYYHEVGMLRADSSSFNEESIAAYRELGIVNDSKLLPVEEVKRRWNGALSSANFKGVNRILFNPSVGFAEADKALEAVIQRAVDLGVDYIVGEVSTLDFGSDGQCAGVVLRDGRGLHANKILLAAGARTAMLLAQSAPDRKQLHAANRLLATGAVSFYAKLSGSLQDKFATIPVFKNCLSQSKGEGISILNDGTIKFNCDLCFTNYQVFSPTGEIMSVVPDQPMYNTWTGPRFLKFFEDQARKTLDVLYGEEAKGVKIEAYRICWDASTPTHDFLISPHPHCSNLYLATGGSFHGWKFLPVIGDYIMNMMQGTLASDYADRWGWDKKCSDGHSANPTYQIVGDLQDWASEWAN